MCRSFWPTLVSALMIVNGCCESTKKDTVTNDRVFPEGGKFVLGGIIQVKILGKVFAGCRNSIGKGTEVETFRFVQGTTWGLVLQGQER